MTPSPAAELATLRVLVVDDERNIRVTLAVCLESLGCQVVQAAAGPAAMEALRSEPFDLAFCDLRLGSESGLDLFPRMVAERPGLEVVVVTAYASVDGAVEAMRRGASDYLSKPFTPAQIGHLVQRLRQRRAMENRLVDLQARAELADPDAALETRSPRMRALLDVVDRAAASDAPVLLRGEAGTGKSALARRLHHGSPRRDRAFIPVSCVARAEAELTLELFGQARGPGAAREQEGRLEVARGGTILLDEVAELPPGVQARLLRLLEEKRLERLGDSRPHPVDLRIVAASSRDLEAEVRAGRLRQELLYRINVLELSVPPLRERPEDVVPLARRFVAQLARQAGRAPPELSEAAERRLVAYPWPGNLRELRNAVERALILSPGPVLEPECLPERIASQPDTPVLGADFTAEDIEREHVLRVLARAATLEDAARILGIDVSTLWRKRKRWGR